MKPVTAALNHVLASAPLAKERLARFAGKTAAFHVGPLDFAWTVQTTGEVTSAVTNATRDLDVTLSPFLVPRIAAGDAQAMREVRMEGDAEFAHEISFLASNLTWDMEEDLSKITGDIAAHRIVGSAKAGAAWAKDSAQRLAAGAAEYWTEESPLIASRVKVDEYVKGVAEIRDDVERLEKRIERLETGFPSTRE
jgi:ubiquinone biosynthesis protein UbiJ